MHLSPSFVSLVYTNKQTHTHAQTHNQSNISELAKLNNVSASWWFSKKSFFKP